MVSGNLKGPKRNNADHKIGKPLTSKSMTLVHSRKSPSKPRKSSRLGGEKGTAKGTKITAVTGIEEQRIEDKLPTHKPVEEVKTADVSKHIIPVPVFHKHNEMIIKQEMYWFEKVPCVAKCLDSFDASSLAALKDFAKKLWDNENNLHELKFNADKSSDTNWLKTVLKSGTLSDKVAAYTMLLQESPVHSTKSLEALLSMAKKKGRRESLMSIDSLRHVWVTSLLPDRKLKYFSQWPLATLKELSKEGSRLMQDRLIILILFEDYLKSKYKEFVDILENHLQDSLTGVRCKILGVVHELLALKPEEEQRLLKMIVNKVGDPDRKVASRASFLLTELVAKHPNMKLVVAEEVERLLFRSNISEKAQYYAVCFLNQLILSSKEKLLASKLISIFFAFFKVYSSKAKAQSKMLSALLSGVNRAFPFAKGEDEKYEEQLNMLFRISHVSKYGTSIQALMLLYQVMDVRQSVSDRFYQTVYEKILNAEPKSASKQAMFLNLLFKSMKEDPSVNRVKAFVKRLFQSCTHEQQSYVCGVLYLLSELLKERPAVKSLLMQPEDGNDEEHFVDIKLEDDEDTLTSANEEEVSERPLQGSKTEVKAGHPTSVSNDIQRVSYDVRVRNPLYCGAQFSCAWESAALVNHFHPSVQRFTETILKNSKIDYAGDPLQDFTLMRFLDRFIYKNPKKNPKVHGRSIMQRKQSSSRLKEAPVNSVAFINKAEENVREDELFFYKYFQRKHLLDEKRKGKTRKSALELNRKEQEDQDDEEDDKLENLDFAREMKKKSEENKKGKKAKRNRQDNDQEESDFEMDGDDGDEFDYEDLEFSDEDLAEETDNAEQKWSDKDYEKALLDNLSSEEDEAEAPLKKRIKKAAMSDTSLFAAADEFAHLLEEVQGFEKKSKEASWEESRASNGRSNFKSRGKAQGIRLVSKTKGRGRGRPRQAHRK